MILGLLLGTAVVIIGTTGIITAESKAYFKKLDEFSIPINLF
jgi:hypothetical protein